MSGQCLVCEQNSPKMSWLINASVIFKQRRTGRCMWGDKCHKYILQVLVWYWTQATSLDKSTNPHSNKPLLLVYISNHEDWHHIPKHHYICMAYTDLDDSVCGTTRSGCNNTGGPVWRYAGSIPVNLYVQNNLHVNKLKWTRLFVCWSITNLDLSWRKNGQVHMEFQQDQRNFACHFLRLASPFLPFDIEQTKREAWSLC